MTLTSATFVAFCLVALLVYYVLPLRLQNIWLLGVSVVFYLTWTGYLALALLALTLASFGLGHAIARATRYRRGLLAGGIAFNVSLLVVFKYAGFFVPHLQATLGRLGIHLPPAGLQLLLPLGLSYLVVQAISFLVDVYNRRVEPPADLVAFALCFAYFPKIIAGPIERVSAFLPRLVSPRQVNNQTLARSLTRIVVGLVRKMLIADPLLRWLPREVFSGGDSQGAWIVVLAYAFYLYNDFAGYTSLAQGISGLFGLELSPNFRQPYFARSFGDFWNRWHISLSWWLRDYVFYPLSRALLRRNAGRSTLASVVLPPLATMLVSALWHGASGHMLVWGGLHSLYLVGERLLALGKPPAVLQNQPLWQPAISRLIVFVGVALAWIPFRATLPDVFAFVPRLVALSTFNWPPLLPVVCIGLSLLIDRTQHQAGDELVVLRWPRVAQASLLAGAVCALFVAATLARASAFAYQGF